MGLKHLGWTGAVFTAAVVGMFACSSESSEGDCPEGDERCACYPNDTCNGDLECRSNKCVSLGDGGNGGDGGGDNNGGGAGDDDSGGAGGSSNGGSDASGGSNASGGSDATNGSNTSNGTTAGGGASSDTTSNTGSTSSTTGNPPDDSPVSVHGQLTLDGQQIVDEAGNKVQLKGPSSMWLNWEPTGYAENLEGLIWMRDNWNLSIIRAAMGVDEEGAYLEDPATAKRQVKTIIDNAIQAGVYVLVDWHDHNADEHQDEAEAFFDEISAEYADVPNVLYELYNEPLDIDWTSVLKPYHEAVSSVIRANDPDNIIVLGTPNWDQDVDVAAQNPLSGTNLMYTLHFYACSHGSSYRAKAQAAYDAGLPLFVTEWGATPADGGLDGTVCEADAQAWHDWMDPRGISWAAWKLDGCEDSSCYFKDRTVPVTGGWTADDLNGHAPFVIARMQADNPYLDDNDPDPPACEPSGTCAAGDGMDCGPDDELVERDCSACSLLAVCGVSCCANVGFFGADAVYPEFLLNQALITSFEPSSAGVVLEAAFEYSAQVAAITFELAEPQTAYAANVLVDVDAAGTALSSWPYSISVSLENGSAGCEYPVIQVSGTVVGLDTLSAVCWEDFTTSSLVSRINVRVMSLSSGTAALGVYGIQW